MMVVIFLALHPEIWFAEFLQLDPAFVAGVHGSNGSDQMHARAMQMRFKRPLAAPNRRPILTPDRRPILTPSGEGLWR